MSLFTEAVQRPYVFLMAVMSRDVQRLKNEPLFICAHGGGGHPDKDRVGHIFFHRAFNNLLLSLKKRNFQNYIK